MSNIRRRALGGTRFATGIEYTNCTAVGRRNTTSRSGNFHDSGGVITGEIHVHRSTSHKSSLHMPKTLASCKRLPFREVTIGPNAAAVCTTSK